MKGTLIIILSLSTLLTQAQNFEELVATKTCEYLSKDKKSLDSISGISKYISRSMAEVIVTDSGRNYMMQIATVEGIRETMSKVFTKLSKSCKEYNDGIKNLILNESKAGGRLDFFTPIKGHEMDAVQIKPKLFDTKLGVALYQWGKATQQLGIPSAEEALSVWAQLKERKQNERETAYITSGFNLEFEK